MVRNPFRRQRGERDIVDDFHRLYYDAREHGGTWFQTSWMGTRAQKCPLDLWVYQEIIADRRPGLIVETGTAWGGSALFLANMCDLVDEGRVITVDIHREEGRPEHPRISYRLGSSTEPAIVDAIRGEIEPGERVMVILDSDHSREHVFQELEAYSSLVTPGDYLIVEDTNVNGRPVLPDFGPGPAEAVEAFLARTDDFEVDPSMEKFYMTFNPGGFLRRRDQGSRRQ